jgi:hypothetical protein
MNVNIVQFNPKAAPMQTLTMQTLTMQLTTTFVDDAIELVRGLGKVLIHLAMDPIERIANACDVAGVLERRRLKSRAQRATWKGRRCRWPFGSLSELT